MARSHSNLHRILHFGLLPLLLAGCGSEAAVADAGASVEAGAPPLDAGALPDAVIDAADVSRDDARAIDSGTPPSRCTDDGTRVQCTYATASIAVSALDTRAVYYQVPGGTPPAAGFPAVLLFQGSFSPAIRSFDATKSTPFGGYYQAQLVKLLLEAGFAVIAPEVAGNGTTYWNTNVFPYANNWAGAPDDRLMQQIFAGMLNGNYGRLDASRMFATGISSGAYMTSRMAVSYAGKFRALALMAGSYATCAGALCSVPSTLPADHPPTLFLHGSADNTVPVSTMTTYRERLAQQGRTVSTVLEPAAGHQWIAAAPAAVRDWFIQYR